MHARELAHSHCRFSFAGWRCVSNLRRLKLKTAISMQECSQSVTSHFVGVGF
jgi:hypothetical protein